MILPIFSPNIALKHDRETIWAQKYKLALNLEISDREKDLHIRPLLRDLRLVIIIIDL